MELSLHISHPPGTTVADGQYREWETLFPPDAAEARLEALSSHGLDLGSLGRGVTISLHLLTEVEVFTRAFSHQYPEGQRTLLDALACSLRLGRSLSQRRGKGSDPRIDAFVAVATALSTTLRGDFQISRWKEGINILRNPPHNPWPRDAIRIAAESSPSIMMQALLPSTADYAAAISSGIALDWIVRDLLTAFSPRGDGHRRVGPVSDAIFSALQTPIGAGVEAPPIDRPGHSIILMNHYAAILHPQLFARAEPLPSMLQMHLEPVFELAKRAHLSASTKWG